MFADLCAGTDGGPRVDQGTVVHIGADIDERRHHDDVFADVTALPGDSGRDDAKTASGKVCLRVMREFTGDFVIEMQGGRTGGTDRHHHIFLKTEREQDGFFRPLVDAPLPVLFFSYPEPAVVKLPDHVGDGLAKDG